MLPEPEPERKERREHEGELESGAQASLHETTGRQPRAEHVDGNLEVVDGERAVPRGEMGDPQSPFRRRVVRVTPGLGSELIEAP